jgi:hyperosmotically inducible protein
MRRSSIIVAALLLSGIAVAGDSAFARQQRSSRHSRRTAARPLLTQSAIAHIARDVRHELVMLPYYGVFDWLESSVRPDGTVVLRGQVMRPTTKSDAGNRLSKIEGVVRVDNQIEVLPLSGFDDQIRIAVYRAIYNFDSPLFKYATRALPPIHIIVKNGKVWLKGVVADKADSDLAYVKARGVPNVFGVVNELRVEKEA